MHWTLAVPIMTAVACDATKSDSGAARTSAAPATRMFTLKPLASDERVTVSVVLPSDWSVDTSAPDVIGFGVPGLAEDERVAIEVVIPYGADPKQPVENAIKQRFNGPGNVERSDLPGGRVWVTELTDHHAHARMFVPWSNGVVMGVAMLSKDSAPRLAELRKVFDTITIAH